MSKKQTTHNQPEQLVNLTLPPVEYAALEDMAKQENTTPDQLFNRIIKEHLDSKKAEIETPAQASGKQETEVFEIELTKDPVNRPIKLPYQDFALLDHLAKQYNVTPEKMLSSMIQAKIDYENDCSGCVTFDENGTAYTRVLVELPQNIYRFYQYLSYINEKNLLPETLIAQEIVKKLQAELKDGTLKDRLGLEEAIRAVNLL